MVQPVSNVLSLHVDREGDTVFARLAGELDIAADEALEKVLGELTAESGTRCLIVDLRMVSFVDSTGLRILLKQERYSRRDGFGFALIPPRGHAMQALELAGLHRLIEFRTDSGRPVSDGASAAERASAGLGTNGEDPGDWLSDAQPKPTPDHDGPIEII